MYRSWIPSATGRVSFSQIGEPNGSKSRKTVTHDDGLERHFFTYERRDSHDTWLSGMRAFLLERWLRKEDSRVRFAAIGRSYPTMHKGIADERGSLEGYIIFIEESSKQIAQFNSNLLELAKAYKEYKQKHPNTSGWLDKKVSADDNDQFNKRTREIVETLRGLARFSCAYKLLRDGTFTIMQPELRIERGLGNDHPTDDEIEASLRASASQAFIYFKNISHIHNHHDDGADSILGIYNLYDPAKLNLRKDEIRFVYGLAPEEEASEDDIGWRREVIYAINRKVGELESASSQEQLNAALGMLYYANTFEKVSRNKVVSRNKFWPEYQYDQQRGSITSSLNEVNAKASSTLDKNNFLLLIFGTIVGIFLSYASLLELTGIKISDFGDANEQKQLFQEAKTLVDPLLVWAATELLSKARYAFPASLLFIFWLAYRRYPNRIPYWIAPQNSYRRRFLHWIYRIGVSFLPKFILVIVLFVVMIVLILIAFIGIPLLRNMLI
jgi:hypothetical protein